MIKRTPHHCHAMGCDTVTQPRLLMCPKHWRMVPRQLQKKVWQYYVPGQEIRKDPTIEYLYWSCKARLAVGEREGMLIPPGLRDFITAHQEEIEGIYTPKK